jgi:hypothetical protein
MSEATMPSMLAYTIRAPIQAQAQAGSALIRIGQGSSQQALYPSPPKDGSYWFVVLDANKPTSKVWDTVTTNNTTVPDKLDGYMNNPGYLFAVVTQFLGSSQVPQGPLYDYLTKHGAGRELQKLEQISAYTDVPYGLFGRVSYILTGQCGTGGQIAYERSSYLEPAVLLMSLMPMPNGQPPYSICDSYTFVH